MEGTKIRTFKRAPLFTIALCNGDGRILKGHIKNISVRGFLIEFEKDIQRFDNMSLIFSIPKASRFNHFSDAKIQSFLNHEGQEYSFSRVLVKEVRRSYLKDSQSVFIGVEMLELSEETHDAINEYVESTSKNLLELLTCLQSNEKSLKERAKNIAEIVGYQTNDLRALRSKVMHDYQACS